MIYTRVIKNVESPLSEEKGYELTTIKIIVNEKEAGYINCLLLTEKNFHSRCPTVWHYLKIFDGKTNLTLEDINNENQERIFDSLCGYPGFPGHEAIESMTLSDKIKFLSKVEAREEEKRDEEMKTLINSAFVDYIFVEEKLRHQGLGSELYLAAGEYFKDLGYQFRGSLGGSNYAQTVWQSLEKQGRAEKDQFGNWILV